MLNANAACGKTPFIHYKKIYLLRNYLDVLICRLIYICVVCIQQRKSTGDEAIFIVKMKYPCCLHDL